MNSLQTVAQIIIIIEFSLIGLIVVAAYVLKALFYFRAQHRLKVTYEIESYFKDLVFTRGQYDPSQVKRAWLKIELIMPIIKKLSLEFDNTTWKKILHDFCRLTLLTLGRAATKNRNWALRFYAAQVFGLGYDKHDDEAIVSLLKDPVPLVFYAALRPALLTRSVPCINAIITRLSGENWITKSLFLQVFEKAPTTIRFIVERHLMNAKEPQVRATCYNILLEFPHGKIRWDMSEDLHSTFLNLKLSAIKYLAHADKRHSTPMIVSLLDSPQWEVRTVCVRLLGELKAIQAIGSLTKCLTDQDWWVRLAAAQSLHALGPKGDAILQSQDSTTHPDAYRVARHVLNRIE
jgi:hypothetical protein